MVHPYSAEFATSQCASRAVQTAVALFEPLEARVLMAAAPFSARINFQPAGVPIPAGYVADTGTVYGLKAGGLTYGWNVSNANAKDRNSALSPDQRYDTLNFLQKAGAGTTWELAVPNGTYRVKIVSGDPLYTNGIHKISAEGVSTVNGTPTTASRWITGTRTVTVIDGRLTVRAAAGASEAKINFIEVATAIFDQTLAHALTFARQQLNRTLADFAGATTVYPQTTRPDGTWTRVSRSTWSSGLFPASLWAMHGQTGDVYWKNKAIPSTLGLRGNENLPEDSHFRVFAAFEPLYRATGNAEYRNILLKAAASKSAAFNDTVGAFYTAWRKSSSGDPRANFGVLIDQLMDMELMFWATKQTGNQTYRNQAIRNAQTVARHLIRADGSSAHWGYFDRNTGQLISLETAQGYSHTSTWARGQAWGIYAFTMVYRETKDPQFLAAAKKLADYFINRLPADKVPFWDFNDPAVPNTFKDSSAAAVAASGLVQLGQLAPDPADKTRYTEAARSILSALASPPYLANGSSSRAVLNRGAWYVPPPLGTGESSMIWGDYYFLEAVNRLQGKA